MNRILGQDDAVATLQSALASGRVHHAWIFSGPRGVGKFTTAVEFARVLLDPDAGPTLSGAIEASPEGTVSRLVDTGSHPDLRIIRKELAVYSDDSEIRNRKQTIIPIGVLRERMLGDHRHDGAAYRSASLGHGKVFIIDEAELLDAIGQSALLKTLEEPPPATYIILVTAPPERLLPTIVSRCQRVTFGPLDHAAMTEWFRRSGLATGDADDAAWLERFAEGSPGRAELAVTYGFTGWRHTLEPLLDRLEQGVFPVELGGVLAEQVEQFSERWVKEHKNASKDAANKDGARHLLGFLAAHVRSRLRAVTEAAEDPAAWLAILDLIRDAERQLAANVNLKQLLEHLVVEWAAVTGTRVPSGSAS